MADGSQHEFNFPRHSAPPKLPAGELVVDLFAGGGGASYALEAELGRAVDIAINHNEIAIGMHAANHPLTRHLCEDVFKADPCAETGGRRIGWLHASPDCTHFSQAKGGQPRSREIRALAWVILKWVGKTRKRGAPPRIVSLENVEQMLKWGPLVAKRDKTTGRVVKLDGSIAAPGERTPLREQFLVPDKRHEGRTWRQFVAAMAKQGVPLEYRKLVARHWGAGTTRKRLFGIGRSDGVPVRWPEPTHGPDCSLPFVTAADCIDWSKEGRSIFNRARPLVRNTIMRVLDGARRGHWPQPYIDALEALRDGQEPRLLLTPEEVEAFGITHMDSLIMAVGGGGVPRSVAEGVPTITEGGQGGARPQLIRPAMMAVLLGTQSTSAAKPVSDGMPTITTGGATNAKHPGCARPQLFEPVIAPYYGSGSGRTGKPASESLPAVTTKTRFSVAEPVIVSTCNASRIGRARLASDSVGTITTARGGDFACAVPVLRAFRIDILYRMLDAPELFAAQGFPPEYIIDRTADGRRLKVHESVAMVGNSVSPPPLRAIVRANLEVR
ncbi:DNA cytosine methyltransferase [Lysobacter sp. K5869]|uniref:DNA cytosine methyltransferase n=1 Tax=Lysobacter sp. K5869 TaxID=2820808 RepID=UPI001C060142|nr:DNA cytosine methyltransferase [Lysobacter sp. K5869]QWP79185.1 DNA cytosine methyltransferase [Lysobacter sp. K5869]